jgi:hypothetical protein
MTGSIQGSGAPAKRRWNQTAMPRGASIVTALIGSSSGMVRDVKEEAGGAPREARGRRLVL